MPSFFYRAVTEDGKIVRNKVEEINRKALIKKLIRNGLTPIAVRQRAQTVNSSSKTKRRRNVSDISSIIQDSNMYVNLEKENQKSWFTRTNEKLIARTSKIKSRDLVVFTQDFYLLKKANFNNIHALTTIIDKTENLRFKEILKDILAGVEAGENMYTTMEYYDDVFPYLYINMIRVGELSGSLTKSLEEAVAYLDETTALNKRLKSIIIPNVLLLIGIIILLFVGILVIIPLIQNVFMLVGILILLIVGILVIIPIIQNVFKSMGSTEQLPAITLWFAGVVDKLMKYWYIPLGIIGAIVIVVFTYIRTPKGRYNWDYFKYTMPLFGKLIFSLDFMRLARAMLLNLKNGIRIQDALEVSKNLNKNYVMRSIIESSINNMIIGQSWIEPFEKSNLAPSMVIEMLNIGMKTDLQEMLEKLVEYMEIDINNTIQRIMKILPEVVYAIVGVFLIFLVIVVLVPCIQAYMGGWLFSAAGM